MTTIHTHTFQLPRKLIISHTLETSTCPPATILQAPLAPNKSSNVSARKPRTTYERHVDNILGQDEKSKERRSRRRPWRHQLYGSCTNAAAVTGDLRSGNFEIRRAPLR